MRASCRAATTLLESGRRREVLRSAVISAWRNYLLRVLVPLQHRDGVALAPARVVSAGQEAAARPAAGEGPAGVTGKGTHLEYKGACEDTQLQRTRNYRGHATTEDTQPQRTRNHRGHATTEDTQPQRTRNHRGHATTEDTQQLEDRQLQRTCNYRGHATTEDTQLQRTRNYRGATTKDTQLQRTCNYRGHATTEDTQLQRTRNYRGHATKKDTQLQRTHNRDLCRRFVQPHAKTFLIG